MNVLYEAAARALGLTAGDDEFSQCLHDASALKTGDELRRLFATLVINGDPALLLWAEFSQTRSKTFNGSHDTLPVLDL